MRRNLNLLKAIGNELRGIREVKNISLKEVAEQAGVSTMYISEIERNKKAPSDEVVKKLAEIYNVDESDLFEGFQRVPESILDEVLGHSALFKLLFEISTNPNITNEERENIYKDLYDRYVTMYK